MRLVKRLIELAFVILVISLFMKNKDVELTITYFGLKEPIKVAFWELVTVCVSLGIIIAALGDFITQLKWIRERRRMIKTDKEHQGEVERLNARISDLESENERLKKEMSSSSTRTTDLDFKVLSKASPKEPPQASAKETPKESPTETTTPETKPE